MEQETGQKSQFKFQIKSENNVEKGFIIKKRWYNHLSPDILKTKWTEEEDAKII